MADASESWNITPTFAWGQEIFRGSLLGLAVVFVLLAYQRFYPAFELIDDDAVSSWQPIFTDFARQLGEGHMPVWSHHTSCGYPLLGWPQPSFVYPPMWLAHGLCRLIGFEAGEFFIATLMHAFLAAATSFVYLRRFDVHPLAATTAALGASLSGILLGLGACWPTYVFTAAYWPMVFLTLEELRSRPRASWTIFLGFLGGMAFLYADLMLMVKFSMLAGLYAVLRVNGETAKRYFGALAIASLIALAIGVGQWYPSGEIIATSARMGMGSNDFYTAPPLLWLGYVFPGWLLPWESFDFSRVRAAGGFFVGPCALLGLLFAVRRWPRPGPHRALLILVAVYFCLALGSHFRLNEWVQKLPVFSAIRWPFRWLFEGSCVLALLSGLGLHLAYLDLRRGVGRGLVIVFIAVAIAAALLIGWPTPPGLGGLSATMQVVWAIGLAWLGLFAWRDATRFLATAAIWTAVAMILNVPFAQETRMARMTNLVDDPLTVGGDPQDRVLFLARHSDLLFPQKQGNLARLFPHRFDTRSVLGYVYRPPSQAWMNGFELDGLIYEKEADLARRFVGPDSKILATLRVGHVVVFKANKPLDDACAANPNLKLEGETDFYRIYRNNGFKAGAFLVRELKREKDVDDIIDLGLRVDMPRQALVSASYAGPTTFDDRGTISDFREHHDTITFDVEAAGHAFVVVTTTFFPRWRATVDGAEVPIERVNGSFMGVQVPPGRHIVRLKYQPTDHLVLLAVSAAALALTVAALGVVFWSTRISART